MEPNQTEKVLAEKATGPFIRLIRVIIGIFLIPASFFILVMAAFAASGGGMGIFFFLMAVSIGAFTLGSIQIMKAIKPSASLRGSMENKSPAEKTNIAFTVIGFFIISKILVAFFDAVIQYALGFSLAGGLSFLTFFLEIIVFFYIATRNFSWKKKIFTAMLFSVVISVVLPTSWSFLMHRDSFYSAAKSSDLRVSVKKMVDPVFLRKIGERELDMKRTNHINTLAYESYEGLYLPDGQVSVIYPTEDSLYVGKTQEEIGSSIDFLFGEMQIVEVANQKVKVDKKGSVIKYGGISLFTTVLWPTKNNMWVRIQFITGGEWDNSQKDFVKHFLQYLPSELQ